MTVTLLTHTPLAERVCATAAKTCYSTSAPSEIFLDLDQEEIERVLKDVITHDHLSVLEHATFTFSVTGVSHVLTHQLVRHRIGASYEQQSLRYTSASPDVVIPKSLSDAGQEEEFPFHNDLREMYENAIGVAETTYEALVAAGVPKEDARYVLPMGVTSNIVITMNARELRHFFSLRMCNRAQKEIRELADEMYKLCVNVAPLLFQNAGPGCANGKGCPEGKRSCGNPVTLPKVNDD